jgi:hypothetical protein
MRNGDLVLLCVSAALRVFIPLLVCASALIAQQPDLDQPEASSNSLVSASSPGALSYTPLNLAQKYVYSVNETLSPVRWIGFAVHAAMDQAQKSPPESCASTLRVILHEQANRSAFADEFSPT